MKIYNNINLCGNELQKAVISGVGAAITGGIKYDATAQKLKLYYDGDWHDVGGTSQTTNYVSGSFTLGPNSSVGDTGTEIIGSGTNTTMPIYSKASSGTGTQTALKIRLTSEGKLIIGTIGTGAKYIKLDIASTLAGQTVAYADLVVNSNEKYFTLENPFKSTNIIIEVYEKTVYKVDPTGNSGDPIEGYEKVECETMILNPSGNCNIVLGFKNTGATSTNTIGYKVVIVGARSAIDSNTHVETPTASGIENIKITPSDTPPIWKEEWETSVSENDQE
jgi:hypothetical protein